MQHKQCHMSSPHSIHTPHCDLSPDKGVGLDEVEEYEVEGKHPVVRAVHGGPGTTLAVRLDKHPAAPEIACHLATSVGGR